MERVTSADVSLIDALNDAESLYILTFQLGTFFLCNKFFEFRFGCFRIVLRKVGGFHRILLSIREDILQKINMREGKRIVLMLPVIVKYELQKNLLP